MKDPISTIETAIVNRLITHNTTDDEKFKWPFKCKYIGGYGGQFESAEELAQAAQNAPGLWVAYDGESGELDNGLYYSRLVFVVFALARSFSPDQLRKGGAGVIGLYQLIEAVRLALCNQTLGLKLTQPLELMDIRPLWRDGPQGLGISLSAIRLSARVALEAPANIELDDVICPAPYIAADWDIDGMPAIEDIWRLKP